MKQMINEAVKKNFNQDIKRDKELAQHKPEMSIAR